MQTTKLNKATKIVCAMLTVLLLALTPIFFAGCDASIAEIQAAAEKAARTYYANHTGYEKFADITFTSKATVMEKEIIELEYKKTADATELTKGNFTNTDTYVCDAVLSVKNVTNGEGNEAINDIAINITIESTETQKTNVLNNNQMVEEETNITTGTATYNLAPVVVDNEITYYITKVSTTQENNGVVETIRNHRVFEDRDAYIALVSDVLEFLNDDSVEDVFFGLVGSMEAAFYASMFNVSKVGNAITGAYEMRGFAIDGSYEIINQSMCNTVSFANNKIDKATAYTEYSSDSWSMDRKIEVSIADGAKNSPSIVILNSTVDEDLYVAAEDLFLFEAHTNMYN